MSNVKFAFDVCLYGETQSFSSTLSKGRVRIFYKGLNRNRTYITDEFANSLLSSLPYAPIVGKFEEGDFSDHGHGEQLQVYGVIPAEPNISWEKHQDYDGIEREYACGDVLLWTARFPEASSILTKSQSMEIWPKSVEGEWVYANGVKYFKFTKGSFLGLTALGEYVEPCFEGAAFYSLQQSIDEFVKELNIYNKNNGGQEVMDYKFKLSDSQKQDAIFNLINPNIDSGYVEAVVCDVYDDYALCYNFYEGKYFRAYYTKDDSTDEVTVADKVDAYVLDLVQSEYEIVKKLRETVDSFAAVQEKLDNYENLQTESANKETEYTTKKTELEGEIEKLNTQISELNTQISTYQTEEQNFTQQKETFESKIEELNSQITGLNTQIDELNTYKVNNENQIKSNYLTKYSAKLPEQIVQELKEKLADYSVEDFKKEVSVEVLTANEEALFEKKQEFIPSGDFSSLSDLTGAERLLAETIQKKS